MELKFKFNVQLILGSFWGREGGMKAASQLVLHTGRWGCSPPAKGEKQGGGQGHLQPDRSVGSKAHPRPAITHT